MNSAKASDSKSTGHQRGANAVAAAPQPLALGQRLGNQGLGQLLRSRRLQPKLTVSNPNDVYEQEADRIADQVMRMADPQQQSFTRSNVSAQRKCKSCEEELHRSPESSAAPSVDVATEQSISSLSGRGSPLPQSVRAFMEPRFNADFSQVRVHNDAHAHALARAVSAQAFTVGRNVVFGAGHYAPESDTGKRLLAHELTHVVQQTTTSRSALAAGTVQRDAALSAGDEERVDDIHEGAWVFITELGTAQAVHQSRRRAEWITLLEGVLRRIPDIEQHPEKISGVSVELQNYMDHIMAEVEQSDAEWRAIERRYKDEHAWLLKQGSDDATLAARQLEQWYTEAKLWLDRGAIDYITDEDFATLEDGLTRGRHVSIGVLKASRERARRLEELLDVVAELRGEGEDEEKYVPRWNVHVQSEVDNLQRLIEASHASHVYDYRAQFVQMRSALVAKRDATLKAQKREVPFEAKVLLAGIGIADGLVGGFIETAKRVFDLAQIGAHFATFGRYEPQFVSGTAEAAAQGVSSRELVIGEIKGQTIDRFLAPARLLEAIDKDDWKGIGREAVGVWDLARATKHSRRNIKRVPELLAKVRRAERILRARVLGLIIEQPRLLPFAQLGLTPFALPDPLPSGPVAATIPPPVSPSAVMSNGTTARADSGASHSSLSTGSGSTSAPVPRVESSNKPIGFVRRPEQESARSPGGKQAADIPPKETFVRGFWRADEPGHAPTAPPPSTHQRLLDRLRKGIDPTLRGPARHVKDPPPSDSTFRRGLYDGDDAYEAYNDALAVSNGREVGLVRDPQSGEYAVTIGNEYSVGTPGGPQNWHFVIHYHPSGALTLSFRLPSEGDLMTMASEHIRSGAVGSVHQFLEFDIPGQGRGRTEYGFEPANEAQPLYVRIHKPGMSAQTLRFKDGSDYIAYWNERKIHVGQGSITYGRMWEHAANRLGHSPHPPKPDSTTASKPLDWGEPKVVVDDAYMEDARRAIGGSRSRRFIARVQGRIPNAVFDYAVDHARRAASASIDEGGFRRPSHLPDHLNACAIQGACGLGSQQVALALMSAGVPAKQIYVNQVADISGLGRHRFVVCAMPGGGAMLVDTTFAQFIGKYDPAMLKNPAASKLSRELLGRGYAVLTEERANLYLRMVIGGDRVPHHRVPKVRVADFTRDSANLAKDPTLIKEPPR